MKLAVLWEDTFGVKACSYNLHSLVCRLPDQEHHRGPPCFEAEWWQENQIQAAKSGEAHSHPLSVEARARGGAGVERGRGREGGDLQSFPLTLSPADIKHRTTGQPELLYAASLLIDDALAVVRATPGVDLSAFALSSRGPPRNQDPGGDFAGRSSMCLGPGTVLTGDKVSFASNQRSSPRLGCGPSPLRIFVAPQRTKALGCWTSYLDDCKDAVIGREWLATLRSPPAGLVVLEYARVANEGGDEFHSKLWGAPKSRESLYASCSFEEGSDDQVG